MINKKLYRSKVKEAIFYSAFIFFAFTIFAGLISVFVNNMGVQ